MKMILFNADITTMDNDCPKAEAVCLENNRIAACGSNEDILSLRDEETMVRDLGGAAVYPGFVDTHLHILNLAVTSRNLVLNDIRSRVAVLEAVRERAAILPEGSVLDGRGFNEDLWEDNRLLTREELDKAAPNHVVRLTRVCGHMVIANSAAIRNAGITETTMVPEGGEIDLERGIFNENAIDLLLEKASDGGVDLCKELLYDGMSRAADAGLTGIYTDDFGAGGFAFSTVVEAYRQLESEGKMPVRVVQQCALATDTLWQAFNNAGLRYGQGSDMYRIGPRKLYADGSLGARTACLSVPYADHPDRQGVPIYTQEEMRRLAVQTHKEGMPFVVHAIGDAAVDSVLDAVAYAREKVPGTEMLPSGVVHCQITRPEQLHRIAEMKVPVYAQPVFAEYDLHICRDRVGEELESSSYAWKTMYDLGVCISSGSDCPVEPLDPAKNIYCAVARKDFEFQPAEGWTISECLSVEEAVNCHTVKAAAIVGREDRLGRIKPGYLADLSVFPKAFDSIPENEIPAQKPLFTVVGGKVREIIQ